MPFMIMDHAVDPRQKLRDDIGDISEVELFNNQVLCAVYIRPNKTKSGIILSDYTTDEDKVQSKVGLVLKKGAGAFVDENNTWFNGVDVEENDWIFFRPSDGWSITINNVLCRILDDINIRGRVDRPDRVW